MSNTYTKTATNSGQNKRIFLRNVFISVFCLLALIAFFLGTLYSNIRVQNAAENQYRSYLLADELRQSSDDLTRLARTYVITKNPAFLKQYQEILAIRSGQKVRPQDYHRIYWDFVAANGTAPRPDSTVQKDLLLMMKESGFTPNELTKLSEANKLSNDLVKMEEEAFGLIASTTDTEEKQAKAIAMLHSPTYHAEKAKIMRPVDDFFKMMEERTERFVEESQRILEIMQWLFGATGLLLTFMLWKTYQSLQFIIGGSVEQLCQSIQNLSEGDFSNPITLPKNAKPDSILSLLNVMQGKLGELIGELRHVALALGKETEVIHNAIGETKRFSENQLSVAQATTAELEELVTGIHQSSQNANEASTLAQDTQPTLEKGSTVIKQTMDSIASIAECVREASSNIEALDEQAQQINLVINVIREIADQTNLLALNAAIEAARAGEQGRGFAVVADEVRKLAERTSSSTQEIIEIVGKIQHSAKRSVNSMSDGVAAVEAGVVQAQSAGDSLEEIRSGAKKIITGVSEISATIQLQAQSANLVCSNIEKTTELSESTSVQIAQISVTIERLHTLTDSLSEHVRHFKL